MGLDEEAIKEITYNSMAHVQLAMNDLDDEDVRRYLKGVLEGMSKMCNELIKHAERKDRNNE